MKNEQQISVVKSIINGKTIHRIVYEWKRKKETEFDCWTRNCESVTGSTIGVDEAKFQVSKISTP